MGLVRVALLAAVAALLPRLVHAQAKNILVVILDDVGVDGIAKYAEHPDTAATPNIDSFAESGVWFRNGYSQPVCKPTRHSLFYGLQPRHTRFGQPGVPTTNLVSIAEMVKAHDPTYSSWFIGKYHIGGGGDDDLPATGKPYDYDHPELQGWDRYDGTFGGQLGSWPEHYYKWWNVVDGTRIGVVTTHHTEWATTQAIGRIIVTPEPWIGVLSYQDAHAPLHDPNDSETNCISAGYRPCFLDQIEHMDGEIGRLMDPNNGFTSALQGRTTTFLVADNGGTFFTTTSPFINTHSKSTLYEGGINVPFMVAGGEVTADPNSESSALVHVVDIWATVAGIVGSSAVTADSVSFEACLADGACASPRSVVYSESVDYGPRGQWVDWETHDLGGRNDQYKLIYRNRSFELYDLDADAFEQTNLLTTGTPLTAEQKAAFDEILAAMGGRPTPENP